MAVRLPPHQGPKSGRASQLAWGGGMAKGTISPFLTKIHQQIQKIDGKVVNILKTS
jgi:hypothetical protein